MASADKRDLQVTLELTHSEFTFLVCSSNIGSQRETSMNPFTGEVTSSYRNEGLSRDELESLLECLARNGVETTNSPHAFEATHRLQLADECRLFLSSIPLNQKRVPLVGIDCTLIVRAAVSPETTWFLRVVRDICVSGNMFCCTYTGTSPVTFAEKIGDRLREKYPDIAKIVTTEELETWLHGEVKSRSVAVIPGFRY